ncbi:MAG TPA: G1 family glutamic endopeptidase [Stellaceae bacterium]|nr:G1 family glutamic endopeptidase [Stellaceae bacterium]
MQIAFARLVRVVGLVGAAAAAVLPAFSSGAAEQPDPSRSREQDIRLAPIQVNRNPDGTIAQGPQFRWLSKNWSGYIVQYWQTGERSTSVEASWTVPAVTYHPGFSREASAIWVGIGGMCADQQCDAKDQTLIQIVTVHKATASGTKYEAKYEMIPDRPVTIPIPIKAGDRVTATLHCVAHCASAAQSWALSMTDDTTGAAWGPLTFKYGSSELSAEWIMEAPSSSGGVLPLADFGAAALGPDLGVNGRTPSLTSAANGIAMKTPYGQWASPSASDGQGFRVCWYDADPGNAVCPER